MMEARRAAIRREIAALEEEDRQLLLVVRAQPLPPAAALPPPPTSEPPPTLAPAAHRFWGSDKIALASYPRSGNSLLRRILENMTGTATGSDSRPDRPLVRQLIDMGFVGEGVVDDERVWLVKTHYPERAGYKKFTATRAIVLVRNPFDALASNFHMLLTSSHNKSAREEEFFTRFADLWNDWILEEASMWEQFHAHWLACGVDKLVVRYEDLVQHRTAEVARIASFIYAPLLHNGSVTQGDVHAGIERVGSMDEARLALYIPRKGLYPQSMDVAAALSSLRVDERISETRSTPLPLDAARVGKSLRLYSKAQFETVLACTRSFMVRFGYWEACLQARGPPRPDVLGYVDRTFDQCLVTAADASSVTLNAQFGVRPRTADDPGARGFDLRWEKRMRALPEAQVDD